PPAISSLSLHDALPIFDSANLRVMINYHNDRLCFSPVDIGGIRDENWHQHSGCCRCAWSAFPLGTVSKNRRPVTDCAQSRRARLDRKSTRLNSSHVSIS